MYTIALAVVVALLIWWVSTGVILILDGMPRSTYSRSMLGATGLLGLALAGISYVRNDLSVSGAYIGFGCGIAVWGWLEMSFLMGYLTGPRKQGCGASCRGWRHFVHAIQAIAHHELAILVLLSAVIVLSWHGANRVAAECVAILWAMRASAKLNLFLGVRNVGTELLPADLAYLGSYFRRQPMNFLFPLSITGGTIAATLLIRQLLSPGLTEFAIVSHTLAATLVLLGVLEHWILVLPFSPAALWSWGLRSRNRAAELRVI